MKAQLLLDRKAGNLPHGTSKVMQKAFDEAWRAISHRYGSDAKAIEANRLTLAECIIAVTPDGADNVDQIRLLALDMFHILNRGW